MGHASIQKKNMADDNSRLLSDEELLAIEEMVASGDLDGEGFNVGVAANRYDLTLQDTSVGVNVSAIEQINDRFHRFLRAGLLDLWSPTLISVRDTPFLGRIRDRMHVI